MAKARARSKTGRKPRGLVIAATSRQTGRSNLTRDRQRKAMLPGKRRSSTGRIYHETRKNRSDKKGKRASQVIPLVLTATRKRFDGRQYSWFPIPVSESAIEV